MCVNTHKLHMYIIAIVCFRSGFSMPCCLYSFVTVSAVCLLEVWSKVGYNTSGQMYTPTLEHKTP